MEQKKKIKLPAARAAVRTYRCEQDADGKPTPGSVCDPLGAYTGVPRPTGKQKEHERPTQDADDL